MTEQEIIINKFTLSGIRDNLCRELEKTKQVIDNAKTEEDIINASAYFEYILNTHMQQLEDRKKICKK